MKYIIPIAFLVLVIFQWAIPSGMIAEKHTVLEKGHPHKFITQPIDPSNPFKGRYIVLSFEQSQFKSNRQWKLKGNDDAFVTFNVDQNGFATVKDVFEEPPAGNTAYVKAKVSYLEKDGDSTTLNFNYPFEEFYMDEFNAPRAESVYFQSTMDTLKKTYALVNIWKGDAVLRNIYINDTAINDLLK